MIGLVEHLRTESIQQGEQTLLSKMLVRRLGPSMTRYSKNWNRPPPTNWSAGPKTCWMPSHWPRSSAITVPSGQRRLARRARRRC